LALLHGIHQQDATQPLALVLPVDSEVAQKNTWDQVRARCSRGSIGGHVDHADGMGIDVKRLRCPASLTDAALLLALAPVPYTEAATTLAMTRSAWAWRKL
jgi:hypothetical protein